MTDWAGSEHATSSTVVGGVGGVLPRAPKTWPTWTTLAEWGCEACHTPHFAPTPEYLLNQDPFTCTSAGCHSTDPGVPPHPVAAPDATAPLPISAHTSNGGADIASQVLKSSAHHQLPEQTPLAVRGQDMASRSGASGVACVDCHNPHAATKREAQAPYASGMIQKVPGVDRNGASIPSSVYEYEVCFKCHGDNASDLEVVPRFVSSVNTRLDFDPSNASFHPVVAPGRQFDVPSIPSSLSPSLNPSDQIYCSSCHGDDDGVSNGPHGSSYPPILRERYETADGTPESYENYALCYRCHERDSILADTSFPRKAFPTTPSGGGHSGHLAAGIACAACHDPHGVPERSRRGGERRPHPPDQLRQSGRSAARQRGLSGLSGHPGPLGQLHARLPRRDA